MQGKKKIMTISMMGTRPAVGIAGWDGANLFVMEINEQNCDHYIWMENMVRDLEDKAKRGWVTLIEVG